MGRDTKRRKKVLRKGAESLRKRSAEHIRKAPKMRTPESRSYAMKEAYIYNKQASEKEKKLKQISRRKHR